MNYNSAIASVLKELGVRELLTGYDYIETAVRLRVRIRFRSETAQCSCIMP